MDILVLIGIVVLAFVAIYFFMICPRMFHKPNREPFLGVHYAHRGLFDNETEAPENSLSAVREAVEEGYGIEFDVQLSKDNIPVVFHDASLKRMCGVDGKVWEYTLEELQKMKLVNSNQTIPTLVQVLKAVNGKVPLIIEYKVDCVDTKVCELGNELLKDYKGPYCIESFHPLAVKWYRKHRPDILRGQLSQNFIRSGKRGIIMFLMTHLLTNFMTRPDFIAYCHEDADALSFRICKWLGALPVTWTIRSQGEYVKAKPYFDLFIFDSCMLNIDWCILYNNKMRDRRI